jgi:hypothetical protein
VVINCLNGFEPSGEQVTCSSQLIEGRIVMSPRPNQGLSQGLQANVHSIMNYQSSGKTGKSFKSSERSYFAWEMLGPFETEIS